MQVAGQAQEDAYAELVVQEAGLDVARLRDAHIGREADKIAHSDTQLLRVPLAVYILVQHHLAGIPAALGVVVVSVDVDGGVAELEGALVAAVKLGDDADVLRLRVVGVHAAQIGQPQAAVALDFGHHAAQGVRVGLQQQTVFLVLAAEVYQNAALVGKLCRKAQLFKFRLHPGGRLVGVAGGGVDVQKGLRLLYQEIGVAGQCLLFHHNEIGQEAMMASDITEHLGKAFFSLRSK